MASSLIKLDNLSVSEVVTHETSDPEVIVVEFAGCGLNGLDVHAVVNEPGGENASQNA